MEQTAFDDPAYRAAAVDLLGVLAYGELTAFERMAEDAKLAPTLNDKAELAALATSEFGHFQQLRDRLVGEALSQAQRIAADRDSLAALLAGSVDRPGLDLAAIGRMFTRLTEAHTARMTALGLQA